MPKTLNQPLGGNEMPRFGGPGDHDAAADAPTAEGLDACFVGVPLRHRHLQPLRHALRAAPDPRRNPA